MHLFYVKSNLDVKGDDGQELPKINFIFAVKQENRGKKDSLRWICRGLLKTLEPQFYFMVDTGSKQLSQCLLRMMLYM